MIKHSIAIVLTYLGVAVVLVLVLGIFVPLLIEQIRHLIDFLLASLRQGA
jgi:predicted PurR-regulated permease PerM